MRVWASAVSRRSVSVHALMNGAGEKPGWAKILTLRVVRPGVTWDLSQAELIEKPVQHWYNLHDCCSIL